MQTKKKVLTLSVMLAVIAIGTVGLCAQTPKNGHGWGQYREQ